MILDLARSAAHISDDRRNVNAGHEGPLPSRSVGHDVCPGAERTEGAAQVEEVRA